MNRTTALSPSPTYQAALEHLAELRAEAEHGRLVRAAAPPRRRPAWPANVVAALRDSLAVRPGGAAPGRGEPCPTC